MLTHFPALRPPLLLALGSVVRRPPSAWPPGIFGLKYAKRLEACRAGAFDGPEVDRFMLAIPSETQGILSALTRRC